MPVILISGVLLPVNTVMACFYPCQPVVCIIAVAVVKLVAPSMLVAYFVNLAADQVIIIHDLFETVTCGIC